MAEKIELQIVADNADYIQKTKQVEEATKSMQRSVQGGDRRSKGLIEEQIEALKKLEKQRLKTNDEKQLIKLNQRIAEGNKNLKEFYNTGLKVEETTKKQAKSTNELWNGVKKLAAAYLTVNGAIKIFKAVMASTQTTGDFLKREITGLKFALDELWRSIATGKTSLKDLANGLKEARQAGREYADEQDYISDRQRELTLREGERKVQLAELAKIYRNTGLAYSERAAAAEEYIAKTKEGETEAIELAELRLESELKRTRQIMGIRSDASEEEIKAANEEIKLNLQRNKVFKENEEAINRYRTAVANLAAEEAKRAEVSISPEGVAMPTSGGPDATLVKLYKDQIAGTSEEIIKLSDELENWNLVVDDQRGRIADAMNEIQNKRAEAVTSTIRANIAIEMANTELEKAEKKTDDERLKNLQKFVEETAKLRDQYEQDQIEQLSGVERIRAEQEYEIRQIQLLEDHLRTIGDLTEEHYRYLDGLRASANLRAERAVRTEQQDEINYWNDFYDKALGERMKFYDFREELDLKTAELAGELSGQKELEIQRKWLAARLELIKNSKDPELQARAEIMEADLALLDKQIQGSAAGKSIWDKFGFTDEEADLTKQNLQSVFDTTTQILDEIFAARVQDAQRTRELLDTQIAESQQALNTEVELAKLGYANNVDAKRKELEALKTQREKALKEEEKALKAQRAMDTAMQVTSLITATANIIKGYSKLPVIGQVLAIAAIASMFAAFAAAKVQAASAAKLAEGGTGTDTGMIKGRTHQQGGERFLDHVEVERGEMWGVLSKRATAKYGKQFNQIVTSFNKDQIPVAQMSDVHNNILVDVSQTNERLDRVQNELKKLNNHFGTQSEVIETSTVRIIKRGNKTRIIRK